MIEFVRARFKLWVEFIVVYFPESVTGRWLRKKFWYYTLRGRVGSNCIIERGATVGESEMVCIGDYFMMGDFAAVSATKSHPVWIGNYVGISRNAQILSTNHRSISFDVSRFNEEPNLKKIEFQEKQYSIVIEDDVWVAAYAVVLSGTHIGKGSIIGAGAVISGFIPPYSLVVGNPGRVVKSRISNRSNKYDEVLRN